MGPRISFLCAAVLIAATLSACGSKESAKPSSETPNAQGAAAVMKDPVTLTVWERYATSDEEFQKYYQEPIQKIFPNVTLQLVRQKIDDLIIASQIPDIIDDYNGNLNSLGDAGLLQNIEPLAQKHGLNFSQFETVFVNAVRDLQSNYVTAVPFYSQFNALYYNKTIFDKFSVPYPKDGMTWNDTLELARKLTRVSDGVSYTGLNYESFFRLYAPFSLSMVDPKTGKAKLNAPQLKDAFELGKEIHNLGTNVLPTSSPNFLKQTTGMLTFVNFLPQLAKADSAGIDWDIAQFPSWPQLSNVSSQVDIHALFIPKGSTHQDQAMEVMKALTSKETQLAYSRDLGQMTVLTDTTVRNSFGQNMPILKGKHIEGILKSKVAPAPIVSKYDGPVKNALNKYYNNFIAGQYDANTALSMAQEEANQAIAAAQAK